MDRSRNAPRKFSHHDTADLTKPTNPPNRKAYIPKTVRELRAIKAMLTTWNPITVMNPAVAEKAALFPLFLKNPRNPEHRLGSDKGKSFKTKVDYDNKDSNLSWSSSQDENILLDSVPIDNNIVHKVSEIYSKDKKAALPPKKNDQQERNQAQKNKQSIPSNNQEQINDGPVFLLAAASQETLEPEVILAPVAPKIAFNLSEYNNIGLHRQIPLHQIDSYNGLSEDSMSSDANASLASSSSSEGDMTALEDTAEESTVTTVIIPGKQRTEPTGFVQVNLNLFSSLAERLGVSPNTCTWMVRTKTGETKPYKTSVIDSLYGNAEGFEIAAVSLHYSEFVPVDRLFTPEGLKTLLNTNARKAPRPPEAPKRLERNKHYHSQHYLRKNGF